MRKTMVPKITSEAANCRRCLRIGRWIICVGIRKERLLSPVNLQMFIARLRAVPLEPG